MNVTSATLIGRGCAEVHATGPRGGHYEFIVRFHPRRRVLLSGFQHKPPGGFLEAPDLPPSIADAARGVMPAQ